MHNCLKKILFAFVIVALFSSCQSHHFIIDKANILDATAKKNLENTISTYNKRTTCSIYIYSIDKLPENKDASVYTKEIANTLDLNKNKLDNSVIIFISLQDKKIILQPEYGLEGPIDAAVSQLIVADLKRYFSKTLYQDGITSAVTQIIELTDKLSWKIKPFTQDNIQRNDIIELKNFEVKNVMQDSIIVNMKDFGDLTIYTTKYMDDLTKSLSTNEKASAIIYYRPVVGKTNAGFLINVVHQN